MSSRPDIELIGVPFDGYGRPGNQARASAALRDAGLAGAFSGHEVHDGADLSLPAPTAERAPGSGLINEPALLATTDALHDRIGAAVAGSRFPVVYGGDCSVLLGIVPGLRDAIGDPGLLFIDGHEDTMPLDVSEDGEAANAEIGLLLGMTVQLLTGPLSRRLPALSRDALAILGPRDEAWRQQFNVGSLTDAGVFVRALGEVAPAPAAAASAAAQQIARGAQGWWLHTDLDVLDPTEVSSQGIPGFEDEPGGLTWDQLTELLIAAVRAEGCLGWSLVIYDPDQDADGSDAERIVRLAADLAAHLS